MAIETTTTPQTNPRRLLCRRRGRWVRGDALEGEVRGRVAGTADPRAVPPLPVKAGTERAFSGKYWDTKTARHVRLRLLRRRPVPQSETKFDSGTGWPSFYAADHARRPWASTATPAHGMVRVESLCGTCNAHLGHVFPDGPRPTGLRYCMNSASLNLKPDAK